MPFPDSGLFFARPHKLAVTSLGFEQIRCQRLSLAIDLFPPLTLLQFLDSIPQLLVSSFYFGRMFFLSFLQWPHPGMSLFFPLSQFLFFSPRSLFSCSSSFECDSPIISSLNPQVKEIPFPSFMFSSNIQETDFHPPLFSLAFKGPACPEF